MANWTPVPFDADALAASYGGGNATFEKPLSGKELLKSSKFARQMQWTCETGRPFIWMGGQGVAKTAFKRAAATASGFRYVYVNTSMVSTDSWHAPMPAIGPDGTIEYMRSVFFEGMFPFDDDRPLVIDLDEINRVADGNGSLFLELLTHKSIKGEKPDVPIIVWGSGNYCSDAYAGTSGMDRVIRDRVSAELNVGVADVPWIRHLANRYPDRDLNELYELYLSLDSTTHEVFSPRVLTGVLDNILVRNLPGELALPVINGRRQPITVPTGTREEQEESLRRNGTIPTRDVTEQTIESIAAAVGARNPEKTHDIVDRMWDAMVAHGGNILLDGDPGIGKTEKMLARGAEAGFRVIYWPAPVMAAEDMGVPVPVTRPDGKDALRMIGFEELMIDDGVPRVVIIDDRFRVESDRTSNAFMEIENEHTYNGMPIPNLVGVVALTNSTTYNGHDLDTGIADLAQAARYPMALTVTREEMRSHEWLREHLGEDIEPFLAWWEEDLADPERPYMQGEATPRTIHRMFDHWANGLDIESAVPLNDDMTGRVDLDLYSLEQRLAANARLSIFAFAREADEWVEKLTPGRNEATAEHSAVFEMLRRTPLAQLEEFRAEVAQILPVLDMAFIHALVTVPETMTYWVSLINEVLPEK